jgi:hypothetical protein
MAEQWEYLTKFIHASAKSKEVREFLTQRWPAWKNPPQFTPEAMIPELNTLGELGWELVHMQPVDRVGKKGDIHMGDGSWTSVYFCVFKRRKPTATSG